MTVRTADSESLRRSEAGTGVLEISCNFNVGRKPTRAASTKKHAR